MTNEQRRTLIDIIEKERKIYDDKYGWQFPDNWGEVVTHKMLMYLTESGIIESQVVADNKKPNVQ